MFSDTIFFLQTRLCSKMGVENYTKRSLHTCSLVLTNKILLYLMNGERKQLFVRQYTYFEASTLDEWSNDSATENVAFRD